VPFLRLTRDRRGFENTFLLHADHPGARPRLLYWYRTAPGIALGRPALDEDAIRTIEENHPDIEFDWPAILALSEVMTPEEEPTPDRPSASARRTKKPRELRRDDRARDSRGAVARTRDETEASVEPIEPEEPESESGPSESPEPPEPLPGGLVDDLAGREVARALRARYAEIKAKIDQHQGDRDALLARVEAINPDAWLTPEAVLQGVSHSGAAYEKLKAALTAPPESGQG
jgi:hypothetical protein